MVSKTYFRYIWLLNTLYESEPLTYKEIVERWEAIPHKSKDKLPLRTFHEHRKGILEMFGVNIVCSKSDGNKYHISNRKVLEENRYAKWLMRNYSVPQDFVTFYKMRDRILLEEVPQNTTSFFDTIAEALQSDTELKLDYQKYEGHREELTMQPYALRLHNRRWYVLGFIKERNDLRQLSLERIIGVKNTNITFEMPCGFNAHTYYKNVVGLYVDNNLPVEELKIKVYGSQADYIRSLPIHKSQKEVCMKKGEYSEFHYKVCLTPDLTEKILSLGPSVEVLEPQEYREEIKNKILQASERYK